MCAFGWTTIAASSRARPALPSSRVDRRRVPITTSPPAPRSSLNGDDIEPVNLTTYPRRVNQFDQTCRRAPGGPGVLHHLERERARAGNVELPWVIGHAAARYWVFPPETAEASGFSPL